MYELALFFCWPILHRDFAIAHLGEAGGVQEPIHPSPFETPVVVFFVTVFRIFDE